ncbi:hypothetical protein BCR33DRAFT_721289 [Rhizoclosmatium globosum]|uniref:Uncharacterized protein n=1 Tax=Rhizoclosmatium globosum TaxID=329046 RepID=A0A1Y2BSR1_9FUNG|nr:hypothetical protein BCR33DRAFT_721289 [Rhizoclosmatium globosum]|eukprot:ORY37798.1 hypothetical protein BCR33DRAFT_721289 [Rhizoclosmatium globosum]
MSFTLTDIFLLFKTWYILDRKTWFLIVSIIFILNRIGWGAIESYKSYGLWDQDSDSCKWIANVDMMTGVYASDIAIDLLATISTLIESRRYAESEFKQFFQIMVLENLIRSALSMAVTIFGLCSVWQGDETATMQFIFFSIQTYVICHLLNSEHYWLRLRTAAVPEEFKEVTVDSELQT